MIHARIFYPPGYIYRIKPLKSILGGWYIPPPDYPPGRISNAEQSKHENKPINNIIVKVTIVFSMALIDVINVVNNVA